MTENTTVVETIITQLTEGAVSFRYRKANGDVRLAKGTLNADLIPEADRTTNLLIEGETVTYYDLESNGWRRFNRSAVMA